MTMPLTLSVNCLYRNSAKDIAVKINSNGTKSMHKKIVATITLLFILLPFHTVLARNLLLTNPDSLEKAVYRQVDTLKIKSLNRLVEYYLTKKDPERGLKFGLKALDLSAKQADKKYRLQTIANLVDVYNKLLLYDNALKLINEVEELSSLLKNNAYKSRNYLTAGSIYQGMRDFPKAEKNYRLALISLQIKPLIPHGEYLKADAMLGLAACLRYQNRYVEALQVNQKGLQLAEKLENDTLLSFYYNNIGDLYEIDGKLDEAYLYYQKSMKYNLKNNDIEGLYFNYSNLASIEKFRGNYDKAIQLLNESVVLAEKNQSYAYLFNNYLNLYGAYSAKRDHKKALEYVILLEQTTIPKDGSDSSLFEAKVESSYKLDKKDQEKEILNLKMAQEKSKYINIILLIFLLSSVGFMIYYFKYKQKKINELVLKEGKARAELDALQARINPHFLFNSLNSLGALIFKDAKNADLMLQNLSGLLRYTLQTAKKNLVSLAEEMQTVRNYLLIEKIRFESRLEFDIRCPEDFKTLQIPPLIIQPLVENSIKYAIGRMISGGRIEVSCSVVNNYLQIAVSDNGPQNVQHDKSIKGTGFGMNYIKGRLAMIYDSDYKFEVDKSAGYKVTITVPVQAIRFKA